MDEQILYLPVTELAARLAKREFSSRELTQAYLERLRTLGPRYNAVAYVMEEPALRQAAAADAMFARGVVRSPLQGIPYGAKDLLATREAPTSWGAEPYRGQQFDEDATVVRKLAEAGAVLVAKLAMVELAGGGGYRYAAASMHGPGLNPWNPRHWSGGSSSGPGSAVAAALTPYAIGSETLGSIVNPSASCGVTGLRPTYGLVSRHGAMPLSWTMDKLGPMGRSVEDCALVLEAIAGPDANDPSSAGRSFRFDGRAAPAMKSLRVGFAEVDFERWPAPGARQALGSALAVLRDSGVRMAPMSLPEMPYGAAASTIISAEAASVFEDLIRSERLEQLADERQKAGLRAGLAVTATEYLKAMRIRRIVQRKLRELFEQVDVLLAPSIPGTAPRIEDPLDRSSGQEPAEPGNQQLLAASNLAGLPALSLPCGFAENGLPVAIQMVARAHNEAVLVALGKEFQRRTDWHLRRPPV